MKTEAPGQDFGTLYTGAKMRDWSRKAATAGTQDRQGTAPKRIIQMEGGVTPPVFRETA
jgi:hypothetical protein